MIAVRMVQPAVYKIVDMVTMRHRFVSAIWTVCVRAMDFRRALHGICGVDRDGVLIHVILMHVMQMAIMKVIHMAVMANRSVSAIRTVLMSVVGVVFLGTCGHWLLLASAWLPIDVPLQAIMKRLRKPAVPQAP
jgi:uncharacterized membrane protein (DUF2068 family)